VSLEPVGVEDLDALEARFQHAFATGDITALHVVGYGEITSVVAWQGTSGPVAVKRLPAFENGQGVDEYLTLLDEYITGLRAVGVDVVPTTTRTLTLDSGDVVVYLLQPMLDERWLGNTYVRAASQGDASSFLDGAFEGVEAAIGAGIGFDAQISNWAIHDGGIVYFDVTTPLLRDEVGADRLDTDIFLASLPWALRGFVKRFMVRGIIDEYFDVRTTILNLLAQFHKDRLTNLLPLGIERANARLRRPLTADEVRRYYAKDARMWEFLQRLRRADRWWQRTIRHRPYPFLLPGKVER
jgi:hypothetical protein